MKQLEIKLPNTYLIS